MEHALSVTKARYEMPSLYKNSADDNAHKELATGQLMHHHPPHPVAQWAMEDPPLPIVHAVSATHLLSTSLTMYSDTLLIR